MDPALRIFVVAIIGGIAAQGLSRLIRLPALIAYLTFGILAGPAMLHLMPAPSQAIPDTFRAIVQLGVVFILFDGGLCLNLRDIRSAPHAVRNLLTIGAIVSFIGGTLSARYLAGAGWPVSLIFGALIIVTGPTVILPLIQSLHLSRRVHTVLLWEGILINAVGAIAALVTFEAVMEGSDFLHMGGGVVRALLCGPVMGVAAGWILALAVKYCRSRRLMDQEFESLLALAAALSIYAAGECVFRNSGLAAVIVSGLTASHILGPAAEELRRAKGRISRFWVAILFMLLASDFPVGSLRALWPGGVLAVLALIIFVRPLNALVSTCRSTLNWRERLFIACVGPRGIVAFSVASIFSMELRRRGHAVLAEQLLGMTFLTVMITVLFSGATVYPLAWVLRLTRRKPTGLLIVGANELAQRIAGLYDLRGIPVLLIDTNVYHCACARQAGYTVVEGSALDGELLAQQDWAGIDSLLVMTPSVTVNARIADYVARRLQMVMTYAADMGTLPEETKHLAQAGALRAFSQKVNINEICQILREGRGALCSLTLPISAEKRPYFLPLVIAEKNLVHPYSPDETYPDGSEAIGIEFEQPWPNIE